MPASIGKRTGVVPYGFQYIKNPCSQVVERTCVAQNEADREAYEVWAYDLVAYDTPVQGHYNYDDPCFY